MIKIYIYTHHIYPTEIPYFDPSGSTEGGGEEPPEELYSATAQLYRAPGLHESHVGKVEN